MNISSVSIVGSGLLLPGVAATRTYAVKPAASSLTAAQEVAESSSSVAPRVSSARYATRSLGIEDLSALVAEAQVRARTIELFGSGSGGWSATSLGDQLALSRESGSGDSLTPDSPSFSLLTGTDTEADATDTTTSWRPPEPADENGDGFVSLTEELVYAQTHSLESSLFASSFWERRAE